MRLDASFLVLFFLILIASFIHYENTKEVTVFLCQDLRNGEHMPALRYSEYLDKRLSNANFDDNFTCVKEVKTFTWLRDNKIQFSK